MTMLSAIVIPFSEAARQSRPIVTPTLPIEAVIKEVLLLEEVEPDWTRWETRAAFPLNPT